MATVETPRGDQKVMVKEMSWDPITRIVGSLGIHTEIDFSNQQVLKCYSTSMIFRGFDIFMKGIDPRDAHFITSRICGICGDNHCTCSCLNQNMAYGVKPPPLGDLAFNLAETADYMFDHAIFNDCMCERRLLRADGQGDEPVAAAEGRAGARPALRHPRLPDDRRHHAGAEPVHRRLLPGDPAGGALHARDVLPVRRPPHAPVDDHARRLQRPHHPPDADRLLRAPDALLRVREAHGADARRPLRLLPPGAAGLRHGRLPGDEPRQLGLVRRPGLRRLRLREHDRVGPPALHHAGRRDRRRADLDRPRRDQPDDPDPARLLVLRRLDGDRAAVRHPGPARQPGRPAPPVEQGDDPEAAEARLRRQVQLGRLAADLRQAHRHARLLRHRRRPVRPPVVHGEGRAGRLRLREGDRRVDPDGAAEDAELARDGARVEGARRSRTRSSAIAPAPTTRPTRR